MKTYNLQDLMVPLSEYATVSEEASLFEALDALETDVFATIHQVMMACER